jgi:hypothetical protein
MVLVLVVMFEENLIARIMASNDDLTRKISDLDRMLERVLYGQAQLSLRLQSTDPAANPELTAIKEEYNRLYEDFKNRNEGQPPSEPRTWVL